MTNEEYIEKKIENDKRQRRREIHVKGLKGFIIGAALTLGLGGVATYKIYDKEHLSYVEIIKEMDIHSGHAMDPKGNIIDPDGHGGCDIPDDGPEHVYFTERLVKAMYDEYDPEVIKATAELFPQMCKSGEDYKEAKEALEDIGDSLVKGEDGKYHMETKKATMK